MFRLFFRISIIAFVFFGLTTACTEEGTLGGGETPRPVEEEPLGPSIDLVADVGLVSSSVELQWLLIDYNLVIQTLGLTQH